MKGDEQTCNKRKRVVATPMMNFDLSFQVISRRPFEALTCVSPTITKTISLHSPSVIATPPTNDSGLQLITREEFEAGVHRLPTNGGDPWVRSFYIGEGAYGMVYLATPNNNAGHDPLPPKIAIKCAPLPSSSSLINEECILTSLSSPYVVSCYGSKITMAKTQLGSSAYNLILEYCSGGSIADYLQKQGGAMAESDVQLYAIDILKGISYIHSKRIIHCDIKPSNILLKPVHRFMRNGFEAKLADFGLSLRTNSDEYEDGEGLTRGILLYMSPELLRDGILGYAADIWAYGCTLLEMLTCSRPWSEFGLFDQQKLKEFISNSNINQDIPTWLSCDARDFLRKCLDKDPKKRYDSKALLNHKFVTSIQSHEVTEEKSMKSEETSTNEDIPNDSTSNAKKDEAKNF